MGKYDGVIKKLPRQATGFGEEPKVREKVDARKRELVESETQLVGAVKPTAIAAKYVAARAQKDLIAEQESAVNVEIKALEELLHTTFEAEGLSELKLADGSSVSVGNEPSTSIIDKDALIAWAKANGYERMLTLYSATVGAVAKEILLEGGEVVVNENGDMTVMGGSVRVTSRPKTTLR